MFSILFVCFEGVYLLCDMSFTRCVSQFDISPLNPDTSPEEEIPNTAMFGNEKEYIVVNECIKKKEGKKKKLTAFHIDNRTRFPS